MNESKISSEMTDEIISEMTDEKASTTENEVKGPVEKGPDKSPDKDGDTKSRTDIVLYGLDKRYYDDFPDDKLMKGTLYFIRVPDLHDSRISWLVPVSPRYDKFKAIEQDKIAKYGKCNTIRFGKLFGKPVALLIQNICPVTDEYIYPRLRRDGKPILMKRYIVEDVIRNSQKIISLAEQGKTVMFPDSMKIYRELEAAIKDN